MKSPKSTKMNEEEFKSIMNAVSSRTGPGGIAVIKTDLVMYALEVSEDMSIKITVVRSINDDIGNKSVNLIEILKEVSEIKKAAIELGFEFVDRRESSVN